MAKSRKIKAMSPELKAMLSRKRTGPMKPVNRYDDQGRTAYFAIDTMQQLKLYAAANRLLAKSGFFPPKAEREIVLAEASMIRRFGLGPIWHGRV